MAASGSATGGFSYAQAARGKQAAAAAAAVSQTDNLVNPTPTKDWAEDAEDHARAKAQEAEIEIDNTDRPSTAVIKRSSNSGISSPDVASATSHDDVSTVTQNASSTSSWEAKSQGSDTVVSSEPAWIAERKERQSTQNVEAKSGGNTTIMPEQKPVVLHESTPPVVNPWAKRAEEAKAKQVSPPPPLSKPIAPPTTVRPTPNKENQKPKPDWQHKSTPSMQSNKADNTKPARAARPEQKGATPQPPSVKDQTSWPTPEVKPEEKKTVQTHSAPETEEEGAGKPRKKQEWKPVPVVPNIIWETPGVHPRNQRASPNGERAPRGGASARGRGGARGASTAAHSDRPQEAPIETAQDVDQEIRPSKPQRKLSKEQEDVNGETADAAIKPTEAPLTNGDLTIPTEPILETRKDVRSGENKEWNGARGTARRGGRGRGGRGDLTNGHAHFANGHAADYSSSFTGSPTHARGGFQFAAGRAGRANNNRAQSLPFGNPDMLRYSYYPSFMPYMVDPYSMGMPQSPYMDFSPQVLTVTQQLDYYFSVDNLLKDMYLRKNMDSQGFVFLDVIAAFNRIKQITRDTNVIKMASYQSEFVEIVIGNDGKERLRKANDWEKWILPVDERFSDVQNEGPQQTENLHKQYAQTTPRAHMSLPYIHSQRPGDRRSYDFTYGMGQQMSPHAMFAPEYQPAAYTNGVDESRGRLAKAGSVENGVVPDTTTTKSHEDADVFPNEKIEQLSVCVKVDSDKASQYNAASRTFSNGSIDADAVEKDLAETKVNGETGAAATPKSSESNTDEDLAVFWIKDKEQPVGALPSNLTPEPYHTLRTKALDQRSSASTGNCPYDLEVLYQFWSHFLIRNYNNSMYSDFIHYATEDANTRYSSVGQRNLVKYYDQAMNSSNVIPARVAKDYVALAKADSAKDNSDVFKNLLKAWRNGALNLRNRKRVFDILDEDMRRLLEA